VINDVATPWPVFSWVVLVLTALEDGRSTKFIVRRTLLGEKGPCGCTVHAVLVRPRWRRA
jgi:hypothetical protein